MTDCGFRRRRFSVRGERADALTDATPPADGRQWTRRGLSP